MLILIGGVGVLFWILWPRPIVPERVDEQRPDLAVTNPPPSTARIPQPAEVRNPSVGEIIAHIDPEKAKERQDAMGKALESQNIPIDFFGETVDQTGKPLPGVQIKIMVRHWTASLEGTALRVDRTSDANGMFDVHDVTGDAFDLESMSKEGYELEPTHRGYGHSGGTPGNPVLFRLWSNDIREPLITGKKSFHVQPDGRSYVIDFNKGTIAESGDGDLSTWIKYPSQITRGQTYDWLSEIDVANGGLLEVTNDVAMYVAPTNGYTSAFQLYQQIKGGQSGSTGERRFYVMLQNGKKYGRITIELYAPYNAQIPGLIRIEYAINPTGSRILR